MIASTWSIRVSSAWYAAVPNGPAGVTVDDGADTAPVATDATGVGESSGLPPQPDSKPTPTQSASQRLIPTPRYPPLARAQ
ncbi:hypothetical protein GCM10009630_36480 [Kribbella jejuensis]